jgi:hypothetical protein
MTRFIHGHGGLEDIEALGLERATKTPHTVPDAAAQQYSKALSPSEFPATGYHLVVVNVSWHREIFRLLLSHHNMGFREVNEVHFKSPWAINHFTKSRIT